MATFWFTVYKNSNGVNSVSAKTKTAYVCNNCGADYRKWQELLTKEPLGHEEH